MNWTISSFVSSRLAQNHRQTVYSLQGKQCFFLSHSRCFGPLGKIQHNIKISIKTACVSRLSISCDYACSKWTIETLEKGKEYVQSYNYCQLWTYFTYFSSSSVLDFEQVNVSWVQWLKLLQLQLSLLLTLNRFHTLLWYFWCWR